MKRFPFRVSDEDRSYVAHLELAGAHITVDLDPTAGGIFLVREDASLSWSCLDETDFGDVDDSDDDEGDLCTTRADDVIKLGAADFPSASPQLQRNRPMTRPEVKTISRLSTATMRMGGSATLA